MQHIGFTLNNKEYSIPILKVKEVIKTPALTKLPFVPDYVEGVTTLKGRILAVVNLKKLAGLNSDETTSDKIMVVGTDRIRFGFFIDKITGILDINDSASYTSSQNELGCTMQINDRPVTLLDARNILPAEAASLRTQKGESIFIDPDKL